MSYEILLYQVNDGVAVITLNRPQQANALNDQMIHELFDAAFRCDADASIRAVVLTGAGKAFCAGGDLQSMAEQGDDAPALLTKLATVLHAAITRLQRMDAPVVVAINGNAGGAGLGLALSGDYAMASSEARFVSAYTASGLTPDAATTYLLAKYVGLLRAKELILTNRSLTAEEACNWGMVNKVVHPDQLMQEALGLAATLAAGPTKAFGASKRLLTTAFSASMETQLEFESASITNIVRTTSDARDAITAFLNRQQPEFKGK
jgi:2-(1,2-epoxy-1,2-dihydrophenyl)acetyl-CoA isomerase